MEKPTLKRNGKGEGDGTIIKPGGRLAVESESVKF